MSFRNKFQLGDLVKKTERYNEMFFLHLQNYGIVLKVDCWDPSKKIFEHANVFDLKTKKVYTWSNEKIEKVLSE